MTQTAMRSTKQAVLRLLQPLTAKILERRTIRDNLTEISINKQYLLEVCQYLFVEKQGRLFTMVGTDERQHDHCFYLYYVFCFDQLQHFITVKAALAEHDPTFLSTAVQIPAANWYEREVKDLLGLRPLGHPDRRPLVLHGDWPEDLHPLRKDFLRTTPVERCPETPSYLDYIGTDITQVPVGPIHAGIIEPGHFRFGTVGDTVLHLDAHLFYTHRGLEKQAEGLSLEKALFTAERICGVCALSHAVAFAQAVETAANLELPPRASYLRVLFLELERLYNHIGDIGNICAGFGFAVGTSNGARMRELLLQLNELITGHRYLRGIVALGGLTLDLTAIEQQKIIELLDQLEPDFAELLDSILTHDVAIDRMTNTGILTREQAISLGVVGVAARASGLALDTRHDLPYAAYELLPFTPVKYTGGDVLARFMVRADEVKVSCALIRHVIKHCPTGPIKVSVPPLEPYSPSMGWVESPRGETCHWLMVDSNQAIYRYRVRSATYNNWPAVALTVPGNIVPDFPLINKSFELCYACCDR